MTTLWPNRAVQRIVFPELVERRPGMVAIMGRAARLIILSSLVLLFTGAETRAFELELIERLPGAIDDHTVVMLDGARAMVAWERDESARHETVWASQRSVSGRWTVPEIVEFSLGRARGIQLAADGTGTTTVVWVQQELNLSGLWANRHVPGEGWQEPLRIEPVAGELYAPRLALDTRGRGFVVWERRQGDRLRIRASRYTPENGWALPREIGVGEGNAVSPQVAVHADGSAIAAWTLRTDTGSRRVIARRFATDTGWGAPREFSANGEDAYDVRIAMDGAGNGFATWEQETHGEETVVASRFEPGAGWGAPVQLEVDGEEAYGPRLAVSPDGNAIVAWIRADGETGVIAAARYTRERGWERPVIVQGGDLLYVFDLDITAGPEGGVLATWCQTDGSRNNVWYARFDVDLHWQRAALAEHRSGSAHRPRAVAGPDGSFGLIWKMVDAPLPDQALYSLWFRRVY